MEDVSSVKITPIKCALRFMPPVLILVYREETTGELYYFTIIGGVVWLPSLNLRGSWRHVSHGQQRVVTPIHSVHSSTTGVKILDRPKSWPVLKQLLTTHLCLFAVWPKPKTSLGLDLLYHYCYGKTWPRPKFGVKGRSKMGQNRRSQTNEQSGWEWPPLGQGWSLPVKHPQPGSNRLTLA